MMAWVSTLVQEILSLKIFLPFVPLFVAIDVLGILPIFVSMTMEMNRVERKRVVLQSIFTAFVISIAFIGVGKSVFRLLGISISDFKVAGGILLFILAVVDLIFTERTRTFPKETIGVVPIGIPLIVGPGVLTLLLIIIDEYGYLATMLCLVLNLLIVWLAFSYSVSIMRLLKDAGARGIAKVASLLLAAFGMMMIRTGIMEWIGKP